MTDQTLTSGEIELLIYALSDDVSLIWALILLGLRQNPPKEPSPPSCAVLDAAFASFERLVTGGYARIGRMEPVPGAKPNPLWFGVVRHHLVDEPLAEVRRSVESCCADPSDKSDWEFACWLVSTEKGDAVARSALAARGKRD